MDHMAAERKELRAESEELRRESKDLKRTLEQIQSELAKRPCFYPEEQGLYHYIKFEIVPHRNSSGIRAAIYKLAGDNGAARYTKNPVFYVESDGKFLVMNLYFASAFGAACFDSLVNDVGFTWRFSQVEVKCPRSNRHVVLPHAHIQSIYRQDYNTNDNPYSPKFILYDMELERVSLDDVKQLQMFEKPPANPEIGT
jgi:hypothetical protein